VSDCSKKYISRLPEQDPTRWCNGILIFPSPEAIGCCKWQSGISWIESATCDVGYEKIEKKTGSGTHVAAVWYIMVISILKQ
jgi:hypothetical protein